MSREETTLLSIREPYPRPLMALSQLYGDVGFVKNPRRLYPCGVRGRRSNGTSTEHRRNIDGTTVEQKLNANGQMGLCIEGEGQSGQEPAGAPGGCRAGGCGAGPCARAQPDPSRAAGKTHILH